MPRAEAATYRGARARPRLEWGMSSTSSPFLNIVRACFAAIPVMLAGSAVASGAQTPSAYFHWFEYSGHDRVFDTPLPPGAYRNPVLAGFYPDPSITRVGDRFYLALSTFTYFPGIPVLESRDLVHWRQIGSVIDRPSELSFDGLGVSRGIFAPAITYHDGFFYVISTSVDAGGNFLSVAAIPPALGPTPSGCHRSTESIPPCSSKRMAKPTFSTTGRRRVRRNTRAIAQSGYRNSISPRAS